jgi:hypothetical protein
MKRQLLAAAMVLAANGAWATGASATTFEGKCELSGPAQFEKPFGFVPAPNHYRFTTQEGSCTGTLNGRSGTYNAAASVGGPDVIGCSLAEGTNAPGTVTFFVPRKHRKARKVVLQVNMDYVASGPFVGIRVNGAWAGAMVGEAQFITHGDPTIAEQCAQGTAHSDWFDAIVQTTPGGISG